VPENTLTISAVASAAPSTTPSVVALAPSAAIRNIGSRLWMISDDTSISRLTQPRIHTLPGIWRRTRGGERVSIGSAQRRSDRMRGSYRARMNASGSRAPGRCAA